MSFSHAVFHPSETIEQRLILYTPLPDHDTPAKLAGLLEARVAATDGHADRGRVGVAARPGPRTATTPSASSSTLPLTYSSCGGSGSSRRRAG